MKNTQSHVHSVTVCKTCKRIRVEEESTLPDYCSDISRVISVDTFPTVYSKKAYLRDGTLICDVSGAVTFNVVYLSDDADIECHSYTVDVSDTFKTDAVDIDAESLFAFVVAVAENSMCKVQSPRRISVKTDLCMTFDIRGNRSFDCYVKGDDPVETRERQATVMRTISSKDAEFKVSEEIRLPKHCPPMERILSATVSLCAEDVRAGDNSVNFVGSGDISCVYLPEVESEGGIRSFYQPLEIKGSFEVDDSRNDAVATVRLMPSSFSYEIVSDELGENRVLKVDIVYTAQCLVEENTVLTLTEDIYGVGCRVSPAYNSNELKHYVGTLREENAVKERIPLKKDIKALEGVTATSSVKNTFFEGGELYADCRIIVSGIGITEDTPCSVSETLDTKIRLNLPAELSESYSDLSFDIGSVTGFVDARVDGESINLAFDVTVLAQIYLGDNAVFVSSAEMGEKVSGESKRVFFYPEENDTLWTVGKRYGVGVAALAKANSITESDKLRRVMVIPE